MFIQWWDILLRLGLAIAVGFAVGLEREKHHRPAGIKTHIMVCMGAAIVSLIQLHMAQDAIRVVDAYPEMAAAIKVDFGRLGAQVISGIGFLGAGTILITGRQKVQGLTTAAGLWASACMGLAIGAGFYECVVIAFILIFLCMRFLPVLERIAVENARNMNFYVEFSSLEDVSDIINCIKAQGAQIYGVEIDHGKPEHIERPSAVFSIRLNQKIHHEQVLASIAELETVITLDEI